MEGVALYSHSLAEKLAPTAGDVPLISVRIAPHVAQDRVSEIIQTMKGADAADEAVARLGLAHAEADAHRYRDIVDAALAEKNASAPPVSPARKSPW